MKSILEESIITHFMTIQIIIHDFFSHNFSDNSKQKKYFLHVSPIIELSKKKNTNFFDISGWKHTQKKKKNATVGMDNFCPKLQFKKYDELLDYFRNNQQGVIQWLGAIFSYNQSKIGTSFTRVMAMSNKHTT